MSQTIIITGASGLLGRAIHARFASDPRFRVVGTAHSRTGPGYVGVDLRDTAAIDKLVDELKPSFIIHAAAERRPDAVEKDIPGSERLNIDAVWHIGRAAARVGSGFVSYILPNRMEWREWGARVQQVC